MKSNEPRIGNWVSHRKKGEVKVLGITCLTQGVRNKVEYQKPGTTILGCTNERNINPIPLTEEWLIQFGFEWLRPKKGTLGVYSNGKAKVCLSNGGNVYTMRGKSLPYVHTLQNWYYYDQLTGEELKTKE